MKIFKVSLWAFVHLGLFVFSSKGYAQCSGGSSVGAPVYICIGNGVNPTISGVGFGNYTLLNVIKGLQYTVSNSVNGITVINGSATLHSSTGNSITFTAAISGQVRVYNCRTFGSGSTTITHTFSGGSNTEDNALAAGANQWQVHYYKRLDGSASAPNETNGFNRYIGLAVTPQPESFDYGFDGDAACVDMYSNNTLRARLYTEYFATRLRMNSTKPKGIYLADMGADDGVRLTVDNVLVFNRWVEQGYTNYPKQFFKLSGNSNLLLEYYESAGGNRLSFQNLAKVPNTIAADQTICSGGTIAQLSGNNAFTDAPIASTAGFTVSYQWQLSSDSVNFTNVSGANGISYTPTVTAAGTYFYRRVLSVTRTNSGMPSATTLTDESNVVKVVIRPVPSVTLSGGTTVCMNAPSPSITFSNPASLPVTVTYKLNGGANQTINVPASGNATLAVPTGTAGNFAYVVQSVAFQSAPVCNNTMSATATVVVNALPDGTISAAASPVCEGNAVQLIFTATSGAGPFSLIINGTTYTNITSGTPFTAVGNVAITTTFNLTKITDNNGCVKQSP
ncbi:MAG: hypothetical protein JNM21_00580 [Taibaiella sp.]|nr:hypothetical protein [Taibaiella sp.]